MIFSARVLHSLASTVYKLSLGIQLSMQFKSFVVKTHIVPETSQETHWYSAFVFSYKKIISDAADLPVTTRRLRCRVAKLLTEMNGMKCIENF